MYYCTVCVMVRRSSLWYKYRPGNWRIPSSVLSRWCFKQTRRITAPTSPTPMRIVTAIRIATLTSSTLPWDYHANKSMRIAAQPIPPHEGRHTNKHCCTNQPQPHPHEDWHTNHSPCLWEPPHQPKSSWTCKTILAIITPWKQKFLVAI